MQIRSTRCRLALPFRLAVTVAIILACAAPLSVVADSARQTAATTAQTQPAQPQPTQTKQEVPVAKPAEAPKPVTPAAQTAPVAPVAQPVPVAPTATTAPVQPVPVVRPQPAAAAPTLPAASAPDTAAPAAVPAAIPAAVPATVPASEPTAADIASVVAAAEAAEPLDLGSSPFDIDVIMAGWQRLVSAMEPALEPLRTRFPGLDRRVQEVFSELKSTALGFDYISVLPQWQWSTMQWPSFSLSSLDSSWREYAATAGSASTVTSEPVMAHFSHEMVWSLLALAVATVLVRDVIMP